MRTTIVNGQLVNANVFGLVEINAIPGIWVFTVSGLSRPSPTAPKLQINEYFDNKMTLWGMQTLDMSHFLWLGRQVFKISI